MRLSFKIVGLLILLIILNACLNLLGMGFGSNKKYSRPEDCARGHLAKIDFCSGEATSGWMNSGAYYLIAKGKPDYKFCSDFLGNISNMDSNVAKTCNEWKKENCSNFEGMDDWSCFFCDRMASNGNTHYYLMAGTSPDCRKGIFFSGSRYKPENFEKDIRAD